MRPYDKKWAKHEIETVTVTAENIDFTIQYEKARGVMTRAWERQTKYHANYIDISDELDFLDYFRDDHGRRMPPVTAACALVMSIYGTQTARSGSTTVKNSGPNTTGAVYREYTGRHEPENEYKYAPTKLDRLFYKIFKETECKESEFSDIRADRGELDTGWLGTEHIYKFWEEVVLKYYDVSVSVNFHLHQNILDDPVTNSDGAKKIARGINKDLTKHEASAKYVALFPINQGDGHHTLARAEYDKSKNLVEVKYLDSMNGSNKRCNIIKEAFEKAIADVEVTVESVKVQDQEDVDSCGVFVCIAMLEAADGSMPRIQERAINESDIRKVRCIIARHDKLVPQDSRPKAAIPLDDDELTCVGPQGPQGKRGKQGKPGHRGPIGKPAKRNKHVTHVTISLDDDDDDDLIYIGTQRYAGDRSDPIDLG